MQQWGYEVIRVHMKDLQYRLNQYGKNGWEAISVIPEPNDHWLTEQNMIVTFKRPYREGNAP